MEKALLGLRHQAHGKGERGSASRRPTPPGSVGDQARASPASSPGTRGGPRCAQGGGVAAQVPALCACALLALPSQVRPAPCLPCHLRELLPKAFAIGSGDPRALGGVAGL